MKRELIIFIILLSVLSLIMHADAWTTMPFEQIQLLSTSGAYGFGSLHPLIFTMVLYIIIVGFRGVLRVLKKLKGIKKGTE